MLDVAAVDGAELLAAASTDWGRPVPGCPGWDAADLVRHVGDLLFWMGAIVSAGQRVSRRSLEPPPSNASELEDWYRERLERTLRILRNPAPDAETWTFSTLGDRQVSWWHRRLAAEIAIHRWDAQRAAEHDPNRALPPLNGTVAAAGITEYMTDFLPGLLDQDTVTGIAGTLHLHATDGPSEWWVDLDAREAAVPEHRKGDTAVRGTRSDLLLWLTNRETAAPLEVLGDGAVVTRWSQLQL